MVDMSFYGRTDMLRYPVSVKEADVIYRSESKRFIKGLVIGLAISAMIWYGIVCLWSSF